MAFVRKSMIKAGAVSSAALANLSITAAKIANTTITAAKLVVGILAANAEGRALMANGFFDEATVGTKFGNGSIDSAKIKQNTMSAGVPGNITSDRAIPVVYFKAVPDAAGDVDISVADKVRVIGVTVVKTTGNGGAGDTISVKNGANLIANTVDLNTLVPGKLGTVTDLDPAQVVINAGGTLKLTAAKTTNCACTVVVYCVKTA